MSLKERLDFIEKKLDCLRASYERHLSSHGERVFKQCYEPDPIDEKPDPICICPKKPPKKTSKIAIQNCPKHGRVTWEPIMGYWKKYPDPAPERMTATEAVMMDDYKRHREIYKKFIKDPAPECPLCGKSRTLYEHCPCETPPLKARVAKALEYVCWTDTDGNWRSTLGKFIPEGVEYPFIPPYDEDVKLAIGALEEYAQICNYDPKLRCIHHWTNTDLHSGWQVQIGNIRTIFKSLARAICEAICSHSEKDKK